MHLAVSVFRAIENRVPLARAVNTGVSAFIDGNGRVIAALPKLTEGVLSVTVPLDDRVEPLFLLGRLARNLLPHPHARPRSRPGFCKRSGPADLPNPNSPSLLACQTRIHRVSLVVFETGRAERRIVHAIDSCRAPDSVL